MRTIRKGSCGSLGGKSETALWDCLTSRYPRDSYILTDKLIHDTPEVLEQMQDNISYMKDFQPLNEQEKEAIDNVCKVFRSKNRIPCTVCRYCTAGCPKHISIPDLFALMNSKQLYHDWNADYYYNVVHPG